MINYIYSYVISHLTCNSYSNFKIKVFNRNLEALEDDHVSWNM
jgi:hypothetical protein